LKRVAGCCIVAPGRSKPIFIGPGAPVFLIFKARYARPDRNFSSASFERVSDLRKIAAKCRQLGNRRSQSEVRRSPEGVGLALAGGGEPTWVRGGTKGLAYVDRHQLRGGFRLTLANSPVDARRASIRMDLSQGDAREAIIANHSSGSEGRAARPCCDEKLQVTKT
jgi:hypothetical protein